MIERYIFNFRIKPKSLEPKLPVSWLKPQIINGTSIVSFCILQVKNLMLSPIPSKLGLETICCAYRCGVIDMSGDRPESSVYILGRNTDSKIITKFAPKIFYSKMPRIDAIIDHHTEWNSIDVKLSDGTVILQARLKKTDRLDSEIFDSIEEFSRFIKNGISSYAPSRIQNNLVRIDLQKEDHDYEPLDTEMIHNNLEHIWSDTEIVFDGAARASGGLYVWSCKGLVSTVQS